ncbi:MULTISPECIES: glycosyltransferase family 4 protein [unclassified Shewanella]|uniref:glycosyltransferase family 4 protein n=1 Tax=unclassified Shewanella TaxID=196818 RepID=UPI0021D8FA28|nr:MULTISPECIES: glycosyltransferase family 4 protein [unclassified Shewanella]MCU7961482.1 glycosyltransferase family 4 protein [Shewanella sp. SW32]MCU7969564.1 glycosyltransferase family 4 protein [Shewanella sp. SW29]MCU8001459.1 glycosyltransferase family 4 protein [Shewanella sp. SM96]MCU8059847.1 glycosyltransferase family 4 protein [Shewanella sp. SM55]
MNIALVSQNASPGHLIFRKDLIKSLVNDGHTVYAFAVDYTQDTRTAIQELGAIPIDYDLERAGLNPIKDLATIYQLRKLFRHYQIDSVFSFFIKPSMYATLAAKFAGCKNKIAMIEGLGFIHTPSQTGLSFNRQLLQYVHGTLATLSYAFADKVLFLNPDDPQDLNKFAFINKNKIEVFGPIGLDLASYPYQVPQLDKDKIRFVFVARLLKEKGIFEYLAAAKKIKSEYPNAEFVVLGGLDEENPGGIKLHQLKEFINDGTIIYPGFVNDVHERIRSAHVFVLPSYREGVPRSTQEAMAIGRAVITTDVPGCRETVQNGYNGFLVPKWNVEPLVKAMRSFILQPDLIKSMGDASYQIAVDKFDEKKITPKLIKLITKGK